MFIFKYDPKLKDTLPYWDGIPIVIPFNLDSTSFIGLNLHYLPEAQRTILLKALLKVKTTKTNRDYMKLSYSFLQTAVKEELFSPCVHRYLFGHLRSKLVKVDSYEWENVIHLPIAQWHKGKPF